MPTNEEVYRVSYAVIDAASGAIIRIGDCSIESLHLQPRAGQLVADLPVGVSDDTHYWDGESFAPLPPKPHSACIWTAEGWVDPRTSEDHEAELQAARLAAVADINRAAGFIRRLYVTDIPGQEAIYMMKEAEARAWVASADPDPTQFPLITAEIGITGTDGDQVAQVYLHLAGIYVAAAAQLETARLGYIAQVESASSPEAAAAIAEAFRALI